MSTSLPVLLPGYDDHYTPPGYLGTTALATIARCPRKFFYRFGCHLSPIGSFSVPMKFGEAIHKAMPSIIVDKDPKKAISDFESVWQPALDAGMIEDEKGARTLKHAKMIILDLVEQFYFQRPLFTLIRPPQFLSAHQTTSNRNEYEIPFAIALPGLDILLASSIDGLGRHRDNPSMIGAVEYKTSREFSDRVAAQFDMNIQCMLYTLALKLWPETKDAFGVFLFLIAVQKSKLDSLTKPVYVQPHHLNSFIRWVYFMGHMIRICQETKNFPQYFTGCGPYSMFGISGYICEFQRLCQVEDWRDLKSMYQIVKYEPFKFLINEFDKSSEAKALEHLTYQDAKHVEVDQKLLSLLTDEKNARVGGLVE